MEFVETSQVLEQNFQTFGNGWYFEVSVYNDIEDWQESEAYIPEVYRKALVLTRTSGSLFHYTFGSEFLRIFSVKGEMFLVPV